MAKRVLGATCDHRNPSARHAPSAQRDSSADTPPARLRHAVHRPRPLADPGTAYKGRLAGKPGTRMPHDRRHRRRRLHRLEPGRGARGARRRRDRGRATGSAAATSGATSPSARSPTIVPPERLFDFLDAQRRADRRDLPHGRHLDHDRDRRRPDRRAPISRLPLDLWHWCARARRAADLRLLGRDLWRRQRGLRRRRSPRGAGPAAAAQPLWLVEAPVRPPRRRHAATPARRGRRNGPGSSSSTSTARTSTTRAASAASPVQIYPRATAGEPATLFRSHNPTIADGGQMRDFVWVDDCVEVMLWLLDNPQVNGLFNIGTGTARSFVDLAERGVRRARPASRRSTSSTCRRRSATKYQYFTEAQLERLRAAGYDRAVHLAGGRRRALRAATSSPPPTLIADADRSRHDLRHRLSRHRPGRWSRSARSPSAGTRWPISSASCSAGATCSHLARARPGISDATRAGRRFRRLGDARRHPRRPARLRAVLQARPTTSTTRCEIFAVWQGGMSFHGGLLGVHRRAHPVLPAAQAFRSCARRPASRCAAPIGLFFGRIANFINGELCGRADRRALGHGFPDGGPVPRHPSQLYEAVAGRHRCCSLLLAGGWSHSAARRGAPGCIAGVFLVGYGVARIIGEFFREPDAHLGFLFGGVTMGQMLSLPMLVAGLWLIWHALSRRRRAAQPPRAEHDRARRGAARRDRRDGPDHAGRLHGGGALAIPSTAITARRDPFGRRAAISPPRRRSARCSASCSAPGLRGRLAADGRARSGAPGRARPRARHADGRCAARDARGAGPAFAPPSSCIWSRPAAPLRAAQRAGLAPRRRAPTWHDDVASAAGGPLLLLANEFFDALPIRQFERDGDGWRERLVGLDGATADGFRFVPPAAPAAIAAARICAPRRAAPSSEIRRRRRAVMRAIGRAPGGARRRGAGHRLRAARGTRGGDSLQALRGHQAARSAGRAGQRRPHRACGFRRPRRGSPGGRRAASGPGGARRVPARPRPGARAERLRAAALARDAGGSGGGGRTASTVDCGDGNGQPVQGPGHHRPRSAGAARLRHRPPRRSHERRRQP